MEQEPLFASRSIFNEVNWETFYDLVDSIDDQETLGTIDLADLIVQSIDNYSSQTPKATMDKWVFTIIGQSILNPGWLTQIADQQFADQAFSATAITNPTHSSRTRVSLTREDILLLTNITLSDPDLLHKLQKQTREIKQLIKTQRHGRISVSEFIATFLKDSDSPYMIDTRIEEFTQVLANGSVDSYPHETPAQTLLFGIPAQSDVELDTAIALWGNYLTDICQARPVGKPLAENFADRSIPSMMRDAQTLSHILEDEFNLHLTRSSTSTMIYVRALLSLHSSIPVHFKQRGEYAHYYYLVKDTQVQDLIDFLDDPDNTDILNDIQALFKGPADPKLVFNLISQHLQHLDLEIFPNDYSLSLNEVFRLATGNQMPASNPQVRKHTIDRLQEGNIEITQALLQHGQRLGIPIDQVINAVDIIKQYY